MVDDRITDGTRIAELLASEVTGLETGPLAALSVVDADRDATPSESGTTAYRIAHDDVPVAAVVLFPDAVEIRRCDGSWSVSTTELDGVSTDGDRLRIAYGAAVKRAVDVLREEFSPR